MFVNQNLCQIAKLNVCHSYGILVIACVCMQPAEQAPALHVDLNTSGPQILNHLMLPIGTKLFSTAFYTL